MHTRLGRALVIVALLAASSAYAASDAGTATTQVFSNMYSSFFAPMAGFGAGLVPGGKMLLASLVVLHVAYGGILVASGTMDLFTLAVNGIKLCLVASILWAALAPQAWLGSATGIQGEVTLSSAIVRGFQNLVAVAAAAGKSKSESQMTRDMFADITDVPEQNATDIASAKMFDGIFKAMFATLRKLIEVPVWPEKKESDKSWWNPFNWGEKVSDLASDAIGALVGVVFWIGTIFMYLMACGMLILELLGSVLTVAIALAFTPLMVPWLLWRPLAFLFDNWLKMIMIGSLGFVVGVLMLSGFGSFIDSAVKAIQGINRQEYLSGLNIALIFLPLFLGSFIFAMLVPKATGLAQSLISGGGGIGGVSAVNFKHAASMAGGASKAPWQAGKQMAGGAQAAGNMALQGAQAAVAGLSAGAGAVAAAPAAIAGGAAKAAGGAAAGAQAVSGLSGAAKGAAAGAKAAYQNGGLSGLAKASGKAALSSGKSALASGLDAAKGAGKAIQGVDTAGMATAKSVAKDKGLAPSKQQMSSAASAADRAINDARVSGLGREATTKAGNEAARNALVGADRVAPQSPIAPPAINGTPADKPLPPLPKA